MVTKSFSNSSSVISPDAIANSSCCVLPSPQTCPEIFTLYVNSAYFGDGYYGIKEACNGYLDKEPQNMTLYESTMMAGIPNAPSVYAPTVNPDLTRKRQEKVIYSMVEYGYLTQEEADNIHE